MNDPDPGFFASPFEPGDVRGDEIDQQQATQQITPWENGYLEGRALWRPINQEAAKELVLRLEQTEINLSECAGEHQHDAKRQTDDSETQGTEEANEPVEKGVEWMIIGDWQLRGRRTRVVFRAQCSVFRASLPCPLERLSGRCATGHGSR